MGCMAGRSPMSLQPSPPWWNGVVWPRGPTPSTPKKGPMDAWAKPVQGITLGSRCWSNHLGQALSAFSPINGGCFNVFYICCTIKYGFLCIVLIFIYSCHNFLVHLLGELLMDARWCRERLAGAVLTLEGANHEQLILGKLILLWLTGSRRSRLQMLVTF